MLRLFFIIAVIGFAIWAAIVVVGALLSFLAAVLPVLVVGVIGWLAWRYWLRPADRRERLPDAAPPIRDAEYEVRRDRCQP